MKAFRWISRGLMQLVTTFLSALVLYVLIVIMGAMIPTGGDEQEKEVQIYIQSNGVHTDVVVPFKNDLKDWSGLIDTSDFKMNRNASYIAFGWGDKGFFLDTPTWAELKASTALNAIFLPSPCAMHVELKSTEPVVTDRVREAQISSKNYLKLVEYIVNSFDLESNRPQLIEGTSYWGNDRFYEANSNYHMFNTCNSWTNGAIKSAGLRTAAFAAFPNTIMWYR